MTENGKLFVLSGPSGVGKDTVYSQVAAVLPRLGKSVSVTTRPKRAGEIDGRDYLFVGEAQFSRMSAEEEFLETAVVHGHHYGTPAASVREMLLSGLDVMLVIDVQGAASLKKCCPEAVTIFLAPPSVEELGRRLRGRGTEKEEDLKVRLQAAGREMQLASEYDYVVVNDRLTRAAEEIVDIIYRESEGQ